MVNSQLSIVNSEHSSDLFFCFQIIGDINDIDDGFLAHNFASLRLACLSNYCQLIIPIDNCPLPIDNSFNHTSLRYVAGFIYQYCPTVGHNFFIGVKRCFSGASSFNNDLHPVVLIFYNCFTKRLLICKYLLPATNGLLSIQQATLPVRAYGGLIIRQLRSCNVISSSGENYTGAMLHSFFSCNQ
jgi:hypothetical protein